MCSIACASRSRTAASSPRFEILSTPPAAPSSIRKVWSRSLPRSLATPRSPNSSAAIAAISSAVNRGGGASSTLSVATAASLRGGVVRVVQVDAVRLLNHVAAVDDDRLAGDVGGRLGGEVRDQSGHLDRRPWPTDRRVVPGGELVRR